MNKPGCSALFLLLIAVPVLVLATEGKIYRVVDEDGNVTFTDQPPGDGSDPMQLPGLSIIETEPVERPPPGTNSPEAESAPDPGELRRRYQKFRILQPLNEETFWGTANEVVVTWGCDEPLLDEMRVVLLVDASPSEVTGSASKGLVLDRGEHTLQVKLYDSSNQLIVTSPKVTFFVKQASFGYQSDTAVQLIRS